MKACVFRNSISVNEIFTIDYINYYGILFINIYCLNILIVEHGIKQKKCELFKHSHDINCISYNDLI